MLPGCFNTFARNDLRARIAWSGRNPEKVGGWRGYPAFRAFRVDLPAGSLAVSTLPGRFQFTAVAPSGPGRRRGPLCRPSEPDRTLPTLRSSFEVSHTRKALDQFRVDWIKPAHLKLREPIQQDVPLAAS